MKLDIQYKDAALFAKEIDDDSGCRGCQCFYQESEYNTIYLEECHNSGGSSKREWDAHPVTNLKWFPANNIVKCWRPAYAEYLFIDAKKMDGTEEGEKLALDEAFAKFKALEKPYLKTAT